MLAIFVGIVSRFEFWAFSRNEICKYSNFFIENDLCHKIYQAIKTKYSVWLF